jgi:protein-S-isoprenylcysteine O-methyltransferase Ste14
MPSEISNSRLIIQSVVWVGIFGALLFGGAGTIAWPEGWLYIFLQISCWTYMVLWLRKHNPGLLKVRSEFWKRKGKAWDKVIVVLLFTGFVPLCILPGLDAVRYQWSHVPLPIEVFGFIGVIVSSALMFWVLVTNPYSSTVVEVQKDRGHTVITSGPYRFVRHPMYVGAILWLFSVPLALGSFISCVLSIILTTLIIVRTSLEDKTLRRELDGYPDYAKTVKYCLIPGIW